MDVLYTLGTGSNFNNLEIEYSVKLLKKFVKFDRLFVVGEKPSFDCIHIPFRDQLSRTKNVFLKIVKTCEDTDISDDFLYMMDDVFILKPIDIENYPLYHSNEIPERKPLGSYEGELQETRRFLIANNKPYLHFGVHCPIVYNKAKIKAIDEFYWEYVNSPKSIFGLNPRILYGNWFEGKKEFVKDCKIITDMTFNQLTSVLMDKEWFSVGSRTFPQSMRDYLNKVLGEL